MKLKKAWARGVLREMIVHGTTNAEFFSNIVTIRRFLMTSGLSEEEVGYIYQKIN